jgi:hypothetical protein
MKCKARNFLNPICHFLTTSQYSFLLTVFSDHSIPYLSLMLGTKVAKRTKIRYNETESAYDR